MSKVVVGICTYRRPLMLADCLESLALQRVPEDMDLSIVVVDNERTPVRRAWVEDFGERCPFPVHYTHQPIRGIASARNAILDRASELGADWIAMLDDDETAAPDWIAQLMAHEYLDTPVLAGKQCMVLPSGTSHWTLPDKDSASRYEEGEPATLACTNNVRFSMQLVEAGLRFDELLGMMGGEDTEFFTHAHLLGFKIKKTRRAITYEILHRERSTFIGQCYRHYWYTVSDTRRRILLGEAGALQRSKSEILPVFLVGIRVLLGSPLRLVTGREQFRKRALKGAKRISTAVGLAAAFAGVLPQPYRKTVGS